VTCSLNPKKTNGTNTTNTTEIGMQKARRLSKIGGRGLNRKTTISAIAPKHAPIAEKVDVHD